MTITHVDIYRFSIPMEPFVIATGTINYAQNVFIRVHTNQGIYGVGECSAFPMIVGETQETCIAVAKDFAHFWKGKDALDRAARLQEINFYAGNTTIKSAFDMALYDIAAKAENKPLYEYLGGAKRLAETDITIGIGAPGAMAAQAVHWQEKGATILKIKLGKNVMEDLERVTLIRQVVKPGMKIRLDANQGWNFDEALYILQAMKDLNIEFCEQPMRTWYDDKLPDLCRQSPIPIMADESCYNHHDARILIQSQSCHSINIKLAKSGGISEAIKINEVAQQAGVPCMIGGMLESRLASAAFLHFAYASPNVKYFDLDTCMLGHLQDPITGGIMYNGFMVDIPATTGIGADVDEHYLADCDCWSI